jgi:oxygen-independent coproporphyrinogen-3 oxidase
MGFSDKPGIYLHIPFCQSKCGYCDFYSVTDLNRREQFLTALNSEIRKNAAYTTAGIVFDTIYFGGGTPSLLEPGQVMGILSEIKSCYTIDSGAEITLEVNPGTADLAKLLEFRRAGINRLSIGIQSFDDRILRRLQRIHTAVEARQSILAGRNAGYDNISLDFIYGLPGQSRSGWNRTLTAALDFEPEHISAYNLILEPGTTFYREHRQGRLQVPDDDQTADFFRETHQILSENGYIHYEISNFARSESLVSHHNAKYWDHTPYLGFGPAAHSFWQNRRWANVRSLNGYIQESGTGNPVTAFIENLTPEQLISEYIMLSLRTRKGIGIGELKKHYKLNFWDKYQSKASEMINRGYAALSNDRFFLTEKGMLICDEITNQLMQ